MKLTSEVVLKNFIPAIRVSIAKKLASQENFNQLEIAELLGITQAAVSKYLAGNYGSTIKLLEDFPRVKEISQQIIGKIITEKKKQKSGHICEICKNYSGRCLYRHFALELSEALQKES